MLDTKVCVRLTGGPWGGWHLYIDRASGCTGTVVFKLRQWYGHYDERGVWHDVPEKASS